MSSKKLFPFTFLSKNEQLLAVPETIYLDPRKVNIVGIQAKPVFDPVKLGFFVMNGFYLESEGIEYGSVSESPDVIINYVTNGICGTKKRIHVSQFGKQFK